MYVIRYGKSSVGGADYVGQHGPTKVKGAAALFTKASGAKWISDHPGVAGALPALEAVAPRRKAARKPGRVPLEILEKRLVALNNVVKKRGGKALR